MFDFERLDTYKLALEFCGDVENLLHDIPKNEFTLIDQLKRASISIPLNIAEGCGRWHDKEKKQFYFIGRGSAFECVPILSILENKGLVKKEIIIQLRDKLTRLVQMLTKLAQSTDNKRDRDM